MTSTSNRCAVGTPVWCYDRNEPGEIVKEASLGLAYAPTVQTAGGEQVLYCGSSLKNHCNHVVCFTTEMKNLGYSEDEIVAFRHAWFERTDRETQRQVFAEGLERAKTEGSALEYISQIQNVLGLKL